MKATVTTMSSKPCWRSSVTMCSIIGALAIGIIGLGALEVRGRSRVPSPPAMMTAFMPTDRTRRGGAPSTLRSLGALRQRPSGQRDVENGGVQAEHQAGDAGEPGQDAGGVGPRESEWPARNSGNAIIRKNVPALPNQVTSMRRAPSAARTSVAPPTSISRTSTTTANQTGTEPSIRMPPAPTKNSRRSATGSRTLPSSDTWCMWRAR